MASFFTVPADWSFHESEEYVSKHPGASPVHFGRRKFGKRRRGNLGAYLYRFPGSTTFEEAEEEVERHPGGALRFELGQHGPYGPTTSTVPPDYKFAFRFVDQTGIPIADQEIHVRIESTATAAKPGGFTSNVKTNALGIANIIMSGYGSPTQYLSLTPYRPNVARGSNKAIIWRFPINLTTGTPESVEIIDQPGGGVQHDFPGAPPPKKPLIIDSEGFKLKSELNLGYIIGIAVLVGGVGFLAYQLYKGSKRTAAAPA